MRVGAARVSASETKTELYVILREDGAPRQRVSPDQELCGAHLHKPAREALPLSRPLGMMLCMLQSYYLQGKREQLLRCIR